MKFTSILIALIFLSSRGADAPDAYKELLKQMVAKASNQLKKETDGGLTVQQKGYGQTIINAMDTFQKIIGDASTTNFVDELQVFVKQLENAHTDPEIQSKKKTV